jgi:hypothetical protein
MVNSASPRTFAPVVVIASVALVLRRQPRLPRRDALLALPVFVCFFAISELMAPHTVAHAGFTQRAVSLSLVGLAVLLIALARHSRAASKPDTLAPSA